MDIKVKIKKLHENAVIPSYSKPGDAGLDLVATSLEDGFDNITYGCGLAVEIPEGYVGLLFPRSSNCKKSLLLTNGVGLIDSGYRGEIKAVFRKPRSYVEDRYKYAIGERFAQLVIMPYPKVEFEEVDELSETERGEGGYGSTGK